MRHAEQPVLVVKRRASGPYRSILVATDYSDGALQAFQTALRLFPEARFELVNAYSVPFETRAPSADITEAAREEAEAEMAAFVARAAPPKPDTVRTLVAKGDVQTVMQQRVIRDAPDLVVIGSHGRSGWVQATLGSQASNLLKRLPSDVLVGASDPGLNQPSASNWSTRRSSRFVPMVQKAGSRGLRPKGFSAST